MGIVQVRPAYSEQGLYTTLWFITKLHNFGILRIIFSGEMVISAIVQLCNHNREIDNISARWRFEIAAHKYGTRCVESHPEY